MQVSQLWLRDFRSYAELSLELPAGLTVLVGANGAGKTNLLEAIAWLASMSSFRGAPSEALVRRDAEAAIVRAVIDDARHSIRVEAEILPAGRSRVLVNGTRLPRARDLLGHLRVSIFTPDDLILVKGGPGERRALLDDALVAMHLRHDRTRRDFERVLRHRNALLRQAGGRLDTTISTTLDVWDERFTEAGERLGVARAELVTELSPRLEAAYRSVAPYAAQVVARYDASWREGGLAAALAAGRREDLRRGQTLTGPHRDDLVLDIDGMPARSHRSQGEQRSLALALRLAIHRLVEQATGSTPVLLLDDVFSELDEQRAQALLAALPAVQTLLTSASGLPPGAEPELVVQVGAGTAMARS